MRLAAVDIGSNAVRLLFCQVYPTETFPQLKKISLIRLPIRLGEDVFLTGKISEQNQKKLIKTLLAFKQLVDVYEVLDYKICATSAMREAKNSDEMMAKIKEKVGVELNIIDGNTEADLIFNTHIAEKLNPNGTYLYMDVGGGSTELTLIKKGKKIDSFSFRIGTIRLKNNIVSKATWIEMKTWITTAKTNHPIDMIIGTGGNINSLYKLCGLSNYKLLMYFKLKKMDKYLNSLTIEERQLKLGLRPDRADVITHASKIYLTVMKQAEVKEMFVPKVGLADGVVNQLFQKHTAKYG
ncbi:MAG: exopolyphosphatase [Flavobacteriales bacterium CG18_big_fil_WC_8_21_14_2_50_32_9]|nr:MAG: exopolyphosphatase [Flavobacteriales bacterium CG18_big_fil_WC_8_21_14_2_50_32_9]